MEQNPNIVNAQNPSINNTQINQIDNSNKLQINILQIISLLSIIALAALYLLSPILMFFTTPMGAYQASVDKVLFFEIFIFIIYVASASLMSIGTINQILNAYKKNVNFKQINKILLLIVVPLCTFLSWTGIIIFPLLSVYLLPNNLRIIVILMPFATLGIYFFYNTVILPRLMFPVLSKKHLVINLLILISMNVFLVIGAIITKGKS